MIAETHDYVALSERYLTDADNQKTFAVGQRVSHSIFGCGTVVNVDLIKAAHIVQFDTIDTPRKISFKAKLEKS